MSGLPTRMGSIHVSHQPPGLADRRRRVRLHGEEGAPAGTLALPGEHLSARFLDENHARGDVPDVRRWEERVLVAALGRQGNLVGGAEDGAALPWAAAERALGLVATRGRAGEDHGPTRNVGLSPGATRSGTPPSHAPPSRRACRTRPRTWPGQGRNTAPTTGLPSSSRAMDEAKMGRPFRKLVVPSRGSTAQVRAAASLPSPAPSSPTTTCPGNRRVSSSCRRSSTRRSTSVTGSGALALPLVLDVKRRLEVLQEHRSSPPRQFDRLLFDLPEGVSVQRHQTSLLQGWGLSYTQHRARESAEEQRTKAGGHLSPLAQEGSYLRQGVGELGAVDHRHAVGPGQVKALILQLQD